MAVSLFDSTVNGGYTDPNVNNATDGVLLKASTTGYLESANLYTSVRADHSTRRITQRVPPSYVQPTQDVYFTICRMQRSGASGTELQLGLSSTTITGAGGQDFADAHEPNIGVAVRDSSGNTAKFRISDLSDVTEPYQSFSFTTPGASALVVGTCTVVLVDTAHANVDWTNLQVTSATPDVDVDVSATLAGSAGGFTAALSKLPPVSISISATLEGATAEPPSYTLSRTLDRTFTDTPASGGGNVDPQTFVHDGDTWQVWQVIPYLGSGVSPPSVGDCRIHLRDTSIDRDSMQLADMPPSVVISAGAGTADWTSLPWTFTRPTAASKFTSPGSGDAARRGIDYEPERAIGASPAAEGIAQGETFDVTITFPGTGEGGGGFSAALTVLPPVETHDISAALAGSAGGFTAALSKVAPTVHSVSATLEGAGSQPSYTLDRTLDRTFTDTPASGGGNVEPQTFTHNGQSWEVWQVIPYLGPGVGPPSVGDARVHLRNRAIDRDSMQLADMPPSIVLSGADWTELPWTFTRPTDAAKFTSPGSGEAARRGIDYEPERAIGANPTTEGIAQGETFQIALIFPGISGGGGFTAALSVLAASTEVDVSATLAGAAGGFTAALSKTGPEVQVSATLAGSAGGFTASLGVIELGAVAVAATLAGATGGFTAALGVVEPETNQATATLTGAAGGFTATLSLLDAPETHAITVTLTGAGGGFTASLNVLAVSGPPPDEPPFLSIAGVDRTNRLLYDSVELSDELDTRRSLNLTVYDRGGNWRPRVGHRVVFRAGEFVLFTGSIDSVRTHWLRPAPGNHLQGRRVEYEITCAAVDQALDRHIINAVHEDKTLREIARTLVDEVGIEGITMDDGDVDVGPTFTRLIFPWITAARCLEILSELSGRNAWIDAEGGLHIRQRSAEPAPFGISSLNDIVPFLNVSVEEHRRELHNVQIIRGGHGLADERTELFVGDGQRKTFNVSLPVAEAPTITVDGISQTVGTTGDGSGDTQWRWNGGRTEISQASSSTPLTSTQELAVTYRGTFFIAIQRGNASSIAERRSIEGGSGRYEFVFEDRTIESLADGQRLANARAERYGYVPIDLTAVTRRRGLDVGQLIDVDLPENGIDNDQYLIHAITSTLDSHRHWIFAIQAISGEWVGGWGKFFREILESRRTLDLGDVSDIFTHAPDIADANTTASESAVTATGTDSGFGLPIICRTEDAGLVHLTDGGSVTG